MSLKAPVITSNISSIPEITKSTGILVDPHKTEDIFQAMLQLATNPNYRNESKQEGFKRSKDFSWQTAAEKTLSIYEKFVK